MRDSVEIKVGDKTVVIETGYLAKQAHGSVTVRSGESMILATAVSDYKPREGIDFFPLTVDYREKFYAAGRIPGGFFKREGKPSEKEVLTSRLCDRTLRPLFPDGYRFETQVLITTLSHDRMNDTDIISIIGSSAATTLSDIPFAGPVGAVRVGMKEDGTFIANPTLEELKESKLDMVVAGTRDSINMVEGEGHEVTEEQIISAFEFAQAIIATQCDAQLELAKRAGKEKREFAPPPHEESEIAKTIRSQYLSRIEEAILTPGKKEKYKKIGELATEIRSALAPDNDPAKLKEINHLYETVQSEILRKLILDKNLRADGRSCTDIRQITIETGILPRTHGSAVFTRGETQVLTVTTVGTPVDEQTMDLIQGKSTRNFMLHYNFPPYSVGEVKFMSGPGRREIGHGALAERSVKNMINIGPGFPYTIRIVSEVLESNGSSSMATVCGASLAMMDAGVPMKAAVAGIAMGLVVEKEKVAILSDILGLEDALGDMDFKVAGTRSGITGIQMDIKILGVTVDVLRKALAQAKDGRLHILDKMDAVLAEPRKEMSKHAPRIYSVKIRPEKVRELIGPGGKVIKGIVAATGATIDIQDDGEVLISSLDETTAMKAIDMINQVTAEAEIGKIYKGTVSKIMDFGAFVQIMPGVDGLVHISQFSDTRIRNVRDVVKEGDSILVKVLDVDPSTGKIKLSHKAAKEEMGERD